jgi:hypothetical protein
MLLRLPWLLLPALAPTPDTLPGRRDDPGRWHTGYVSTYPGAHRALRDRREGVLRLTADALRWPWLARKVVMTRRLRSWGSLVFLGS